MAKERGKTALVDAAVRRPAAVQKHKKQNRAKAMSALSIPIQTLQVKPVPGKMKYKSHFEIQENTDKKQKKLEFLKTDKKEPPPGFTFVPVGNPELSSACKEISRETDALIYIVSTMRENQNLYEHVHRIGYHFRSTIVDQAAATLGGLQAVTGEAQPLAIDSGDAIPESQEEINKQADAALRDLYPRIPNTDREQIIQHAFQKGAIFNGKPVVGLTPELSLSRRVQLAVNAHIRHNHTRYDNLLRETSYRNARRAVEPTCLDVLLKWRGDEETGRDQIDEILREVVVIDSEDEESEEEQSASDEDEVQFLREAYVHSAPQEHSRPPPQKLHPDDPRYAEQQYASGHKRPYSEVATRTRSSKRPRKPKEDKTKKRGFKRYQAWQDAQRRLQEEQRQNQGYPHEPPRPQNDINYDEPTSSTTYSPSQPGQHQHQPQQLYRQVPVPYQDHHHSQVRYEDRMIIEQPLQPHYTHTRPPCQSRILDRYDYAGEVDAAREKLRRIAMAQSRPSDVPPLMRTHRPPVPMSGTPSSPHGIIPSIERMDLSQGSPTSRNIRYETIERPGNQVVYRRVEPARATPAPISHQQEVIYIDDPSPEAVRVEKPHRLIPIEQAPGPVAKERLEYSRPEYDNRVLADTTNVLPVSRPSVLSQRSFSDQAPIYMPRDQLPPGMRLVPVRRVTDHAVMDGRDSPIHVLHQHVPREEQQGPASRQNAEDRPRFRHHQSAFPDSPPETERPVVYIRRESYRDAPPREEDRGHIVREVIHRLPPRSEEQQDSEQQKYYPIPGTPGQRVIYIPRLQEEIYIPRTQEEVYPRTQQFEREATMAQERIPVSRPYAASPMGEPVSRHVITRSGMHRSIPYEDEGQLQPVYMRLPPYEERLTPGQSVRYQTVAPQEESAFERREMERRNEVIVVD